MKPMMAQIIPIIPQANCLLIMAIIPNKSERGTNIGDKKNILIMPKINEAMPNALLVFFSIIIFCTNSGFTKLSVLLVII
mgnify:CR=1 FL=1